MQGLLAVKGNIEVRTDAGTAHCSACRHNEKGPNIATRKNEGTTHVPGFVPFPIETALLSETASGGPADGQDLRLFQHGPRRLFLLVRRIAVFSEDALDQHPELGADVLT